MALLPRCGVMRDAHEERARAAGLDREWLSQPRLGERRDPQAVQPGSGDRPVRAAHRTRERTLRQVRTVLQEDLRAATVRERLLTVLRAEVREGADTGAPIAAPERMTVALADEARLGFRTPLRAALRTPEARPFVVEGAPLEDPVLATVVENDALRHARSQAASRAAPSRRDACSPPA